MSQIITERHKPLFYKNFGYFQPSDNLLWPWEFQSGRLCAEHYCFQSVHSKATILTSKLDPYGGYSAPNCLHSSCLNSIVKMWTKRCYSHDLIRLNEQRGPCLFNRKVSSYQTWQDSVKEKRIRYQTNIRHRETCDCAYVRERYTHCTNTHCAVQQGPSMLLKYM